MAETYKVPCRRVEGLNRCTLNNLCPTCTVIRELWEACREVAEYEGICDDDAVPYDLQKKCKAALSHVEVAPEKPLAGLSPDNPKTCEQDVLMGMQVQQEMIAEAVAVEREACAQLVVQVLSDAWDSDTPDDWIDDLQKAIRQRGA